MCQLHSDKTAAFTGPLLWRKEAAELVCKADRLAFPVKDDIPVMLEDEARTLGPEEEA